MREIVKVWKQGGSKTCIVIPHKIAEKLKIEPGCFVEIKVINNNELRIKKI